jgi:hypothetical protein
MFEYVYEVVSSDGYSWGLFKTKSVAAILCNALGEKFSNVTFTVKEIK